MSISPRKILSGFGWISLSVYLNKIFGFITTLILAKLLTPKDFGLVAIAAILIEILTIFKDMGLTEALIYRKEEVDKASNTAFLMVLGLNSILFVIALIIAPFAASFYDNPSVMPVMIILSSNLILNGMQTVPYALLRKAINFRSMVIPTVVPVGISSVASIVMAFTGFGVWSLVLKSTIQSFLTMVMIFKAVKFRPRLAFDKKIAAEMMKYGKFIIGSSIFLVLLYNIDKFYVSKFSGISELGFYTLAMSIATLPISEFSHIIGNVMFPVLSKLNQEMELFKASFLKTFRYVSMISIPMAFGLSTYGPSLIDYFYGEKWAAMAAPLQILSFCALLRGMSAIIYDGLKAIGYPNIMQKFIIMRLVVVALMGVPSIHYFGLNGICFAILGAYLIAFAFDLVTVTRILSLRFIPLVKAVVSPFAASIILIPGIYLLLQIGFQPLQIGHIIGGIFLTVISYVCVIFFLDHKTITEIRGLFSPGSKVLNN